MPRPDVRAVVVVQTDRASQRFAGDVLGRGCITAGLDRRSEVSGELGGGLVINYWGLYLWVRTEWWWEDRTNGWLIR
jgi:hypothetical protein